jgi:hypothetical protein
VRENEEVEGVGSGMLWEMCERGEGLIHMDAASDVWHTLLEYKAERGKMLRLDARMRQRQIVKIVKGHLEMSWK